MGSTYTRTPRRPSLAPTSATSLPPYNPSPLALTHTHIHTHTRTHTHTHIHTRTQTPLPPHIYLGTSPHTFSHTRTHTYTHTQTHTHTHTHTRHTLPHPPKLKAPQLVVLCLRDNGCTSVLSSSSRSSSRGACIPGLLLCCKLLCSDDGCDLALSLLCVLYVGICVICG